MIKYRISRSGMPTFILVQILIDLAIIFLSAVVSNALLGDKISALNQNLVFAVMLSYLVVAIARDLYHSLLNIQVKVSLLHLVKVWIISFAIVAGLFSVIMFSSLHFKFLFLWFFVSALFLVFANLFSRRAYIRYFHATQKDVAFLGRSSNARMLARSLKKMPWINLNIVGFYDKHSDESVGGIECCGDVPQLIDDAKCGKVQQILIADSVYDHTEINQLLKKLADTTCSVLMLPDIFTFNLLSARIYTINNMPVISIYDTPFRGVSSVVKRAEDIVISSLILLLISPVLLTLTALIKLTSKGPVIFKQDRYGIDGKIISVWKFRSMKVMENDTQVKQATKNDPRLTPIGGFLRRTSLDELPQFLNVLFGDMSIVGPRPHAIVHNEAYRQLISGYMQRHKVKPGITGWAQINGYRGETDTLEKMERRVKYDLEYIRNWSLSLDLKIIVLTLFKGFIGKTAY